MVEYQRIGDVIRGFAGCFRYEALERERIAICFGEEGMRMVIDGGVQ